ncbi:hypothetical protein PM082_002380 [Marasmius tenuissimus]|nr:hypothetical protein PM082_002380 [Marasmius tenuissimus]
MSETALEVWAEAVFRRMVYAVYSLEPIAISVRLFKGNDLFSNHFEIAGKVHPTSNPLHGASRSDIYIRHEPHQTVQLKPTVFASRLPEEAEPLDIRQFVPKWCHTSSRVNV